MLHSLLSHPINYTLAVLLLSLTVACSRDEGPRPVAEKFLEALEARDYSTAAGYGTRETVKLLRQLEKIDALNGDSVAAPKKIIIVSEDIQGKTAIVYFREEGEEYDQRITLKKVEEGEKAEWKVAMQKEEIRKVSE